MVQPNYIRLAALNFIVLSLWGLALRYMQLASPPFNYQFLLHAHSHFAFSGWMFLIIAFLIARLCCNGSLSNGFQNVLLLAQVSAWGMLFSFSLQGYKTVSISFSTLFVFVGFLFAYLVFKSRELKANVNYAAYLMIRGAVILLCLSALGPFTLGPLAALGLKNSPWYQDAVYFYLHFQMNGFMELASLGLLAGSLPLHQLKQTDKRWLTLFILSTLPLYFIFTLWSNPETPQWIFARLGAGLNLFCWITIMWRFRNYRSSLSFLEKAAILALSIKCALQLAICFPIIGNWAFLNRNLIIGYIHLLTLGILMPLLVGQLLRIRALRIGCLLSSQNAIYLFLVIVYLVLLFLQPLLALGGRMIPAYQQLLFWLCALFLLFGIGLFVIIKRNLNS